jgi:hypothetical protein
MAFSVVRGPLVRGGVYVGAARDMHMKRQDRGKGKAFWPVFAAIPQI